MEFSVTVDPEKKIARIKASGDAIVADIQSYNFYLINDPKWFPGINILVDHRDLITTHLSFGEIRSISKSVADVAKKLGNGRLALVVRTMMGYGLARMWQILTTDISHLNIKVFRSIEHAEKWINTGIYEDNHL